MVGSETGTAVADTVVGLETGKKVQIVGQRQVQIVGPETGTAGAVSGPRDRNSRCRYWAQRQVQQVQLVGPETGTEGADIEPRDRHSRSI